MNKNRLFAIGLVGLAANILFFLLFDFYQFYQWEMYLYGGGSYPGFVDSYGELIVKVNTILVFIFAGFIVGVGLCRDELK